MKLLHIDSSVLGPNSVSRQLTARIVERWRAANPGLTVEYRDLDRDPIAHLSSASMADPVATAGAERVLVQFLEADVIVLGAPMYNFTIPSTLKAWIDRIAMAGRTFRYTAEGPQGLAGGRRVIVASTRGGQHAGAPSDLVEPYLSQVFGFLGIKDITFVRAEGVAFSQGHREEAIAAAIASIDGSLAMAA